jgi:asparagine synthase (glutamine-hydrolysing)
VCGIAGIVALDAGEVVDPAPLPLMLSALRHRGPDDEGVFVEGPVALGQRRLAIIDVDGGHQPMLGARATTLVVTNGEIYNFRTIRRRLEAAGHTFRTRSDTEVVAHAYDEWGEDFLDVLEGMFALALWDGEQGRLILARDRMGQKPLYYTRCGGSLVFASELTAICQHPLVERSIDMSALSSYLTLEYVPAPSSILNGVFKLAPGEALTAESGEVKSRRYWRLDPHPTLDLSLDDAARELRMRLATATRDRLVSDVPLGIFLSGGLDSTIVATLAAQHGSIRTFSIGFKEESFDERVYARMIAERLGSEHEERVLEGHEMPDLVPALGSTLDEPLGDASIVPMTLLSRFARHHVTVALGGDGGDELFGGYPMHRAHRVASIGRLIPGWMVAALDAGVSVQPVSHRNFSPGFKLRTFLRGASKPPPYNHVAWMSSWLPSEQEALLTSAVQEAMEGGNPAFDSIERHWARSEGEAIGIRARHLDAVGYLPGDVLTKVDRASMAVGLEVRAPFLARPVVELAFGVPEDFHMRRLTGKMLLRRAFSDVVPREILTRPKKGFGIPVGRWINGPLRELVDDVLSRDALQRGGLFNPSEVERRLLEHRSGRRDHRKPLWTLLVFELWRRSAGIAR